MCIKNLFLYYILMACNNIYKTNEHLLNYSELYKRNDPNIKVGQGMINSATTKSDSWEITKSLDRTDQINCLIDWKKDIVKEFESNKSLNLANLINDINTLKYDIKNYNNLINEIRSLEKSKRYYENTRLEFANQELEIEKSMNQQVVDDLVKRSRKERVNLIKDYDRRINNIDKEHEKSVDALNSDHRLALRKKDRDNENNITTITTQYQEVIDNKNDQINNFSSYTKKNDLNYSMLLEAAKTTNKQKDLNYNALEAISKSNVNEYNKLKSEAKALEIIAQDAHNNSLNESITKKIDNDLYLINTIQQESFLNLSSQNKSVYLLIACGIISSFFYFKK